MRTLGTLLNWYASPFSLTSSGLETDMILRYKRAHPVPDPTIQKLETSGKIFGNYNRLQSGYEDHNDRNLL